MGPIIPIQLSPLGIIILMAQYLSFTVVISIIFSLIFIKIGIIAVKGIVEYCI
jgi:predicted RND superfamily exporter protein